MYKIEDVLNISYEPSINWENVRNSQKNFSNLVRAIESAVKEIKYSEDDDLKSAIDDIEYELIWCESDIIECLEALESYMGLVDEWRSLAEHRLDEDEKAEWVKYQVANQLIKVNGNIK